MIEQILLTKCYAPLSTIVEEARNAKGWTGFTGNAQTSYGGCVQSKTQRMEYRADELSAPVICDKVEKNETVYLEEPYEGAPRSVTGGSEIRFSDSTSALDYYLNLPMATGCFVDARLAFPLEYMNYLRSHYASGGENPLILMHQLAPLAFKAMK